MGHGWSGGLRSPPAAVLPGHRRHLDVLQHRFAGLAREHPREVDAGGQTLLPQRPHHLGRQQEGETRRPNLVLFIKIGLDYFTHDLCSELLKLSSRMVMIKTRKVEIKSRWWYRVSLLIREVKKKCSLDDKSVSFTHPNRWIETWGGCKRISNLVCVILGPTLTLEFNCSSIPLVRVGPIIFVQWTVKAYLALIATSLQRLSDSNLSCVASIEKTSQLFEACRAQELSQNPTLLKSFRSHNVLKFSFFERWKILAKVVFKKKFCCVKFSFTKFFFVPKIGPIFHISKHFLSLSDYLIAIFPNIFHYL